MESEGLLLVSALSYESAIHTLHP